MNKEAAESMNAVRISEMLALNTEGLVAIVGNGQLTHIVAEEEAEKAERERAQHGY